MIWIDVSWCYFLTGYLMTAWQDFNHPTTYECVDSDPRLIVDSSANTNGALLSFVVPQCGTNYWEGPLGHCPPYIEHRQITCVVCTKWMNSVFMWLECPICFLGRQRYPLSTTNSNTVGVAKKPAYKKHLEHSNFCLFVNMMVECSGKPAYIHINAQNNCKQKKKRELGGSLNCDCFILLSHKAFKVTDRQLIDINQVFFSNYYL